MPFRLYNSAILIHQVTHVNGKRWIDIKEWHPQTIKNILNKAAMRSCVTCVTVLLFILRYKNNCRLFYISLWWLHGIRQQGGDQFHSDLQRHLAFILIH